jgi:hypothetical protein
MTNVKLPDFPKPFWSGIPRIGKKLNNNDGLPAKLQTYGWGCYVSALIPCAAQPKPDEVAQIAVLTSVATLDAFGSWRDHSTGGSNVVGWQTQRIDEAVRSELAQAILDLGPASPAAAIGVDCKTHDPSGLVLFFVRNDAIFEQKIQNQIKKNFDYVIDLHHYIVDAYGNLVHNNVRNRSMRVFMPYLEGCERKFIEFILNLDDNPLQLTPSDKSAQLVQAAGGAFNGMPIFCVKDRPGFNQVVDVFDDCQNQNATAPAVTYAQAFHLIGVFHYNNSGTKEYKLIPLREDLPCVQCVQDNVLQAIQFFRANQWAKTATEQPLSPLKDVARAMTDSFKVEPPPWHFGSDSLSFPVREWLVKWEYWEQSGQIQVANTDEPLPFIPSFRLPDTLKPSHERDRRDIHKRLLTYVNLLLFFRRRGFTLTKFCLEHFTKANLTDNNQDARENHPVARFIGPKGYYPKSEFITVCQVWPHGECPLDCLDPALRLAVFEIPPDYGQTWWWNYLRSYLHRCLPGSDAGQASFYPVKIELNLSSYAHSAKRASTHRAEGASNIAKACDNCRGWVADSFKQIEEELQHYFDVYPSALQLRNQAAGPPRQHYENLHVLLKLTVSNLETIDEDWDNARSACSEFVSAFRRKQDYWQYVKLWFVLKTPLAECIAKDINTGAWIIDSESMTRFTLPLFQANDYEKLIRTRFNAARSPSAQLNDDYHPLCALADDPEVLSPLFTQLIERLVATGKVKSPRHMLEYLRDDLLLEHLREYGALQGIAADFVQRKLDALDNMSA